jgi:hypothetical protein
MRSGGETGRAEEARRMKGWQEGSSWRRGLQRPRKLLWK